MRKFEKISYEEFNKVYGKADKMYEELVLPRRATKYSAGYDFYAPETIMIKAKSSVKIPTAMKVSMEIDEVLLLIIRSSLGFKHGLKIANQVGVIDSDYYNNKENEGHIFIKIENTTDTDYVLKKNDAFAQGIFIKYLIAEDDEVENERSGGIGSTGK